MQNNNDFFGFLAYEKAQISDTDSFSSSSGSGCSIIILVAIISCVLIKIFISN